MADALTNSLRSAMARQDARGRIAELVKEFGADFVVYEVSAIKEREFIEANDEWRKRRAERDAYIATLSNPAGHTSKGQP